MQQAETLLTAAEQAWLEAADAETVAPMSETEALSCVEEIRSGIAAVGRKLLELYERDGWRVLGYGSWRECAQVEFGFKQSHAYRLLSAAEVERNISPMGENQPVVERILRPLARLGPEQQAEAWQKAVASAPDSKPTAAHVQKAVAEFAPIKEPKPRDEIKPVRDQQPAADLLTPRGAAKATVLYCAPGPMPLDDIRKLIHYTERAFGHKPDAIEAIDRVQRWLDSLPMAVSK